MKAILQYLGWRKIALEALKRDGIVMMPPLAPEQIKETMKYVKKNENVVAAPWLFEVNLSMYDIAKNYLLQEPILVSIEKEIITNDDTAPITWFAAFGTGGRELVVMIYGSDVLVSGDGAMVYHPTSHRTSSPFTHTPSQKTYPDTIIGPAGTMFLYDPAGYHTYIRPSQDQCRLRGRWRADLDSPFVKNAPAGSLTSISKELLGPRYPRNEKLQKAVERVVR